MTNPQHIEGLTRIDGEQTLLGRHPNGQFTHLGADYEVEDHGFISPCWAWRGALAPDGYGRVFRKFNGKRVSLAHRVYYQVHVGEIPGGYVIDHLCGVRHCVNPAHLEAVTVETNTRRAGKLTQEQVGWIRATPEISKRAWGAYLGVSRTAVKHVVQGKSWAGIGPSAPPPHVLDEIGVPHAD